MLRNVLELELYVLDVRRDFVQFDAHTLQVLYLLQRLKLVLQKLAPQHMLVFGLAPSVSADIGSKQAPQRAEFVDITT